jgi:long-subunit fatty acid transport protein
MLGMSLMPAASFKATDWLSLGAGLNAMYGYMDTEVALRALAAGDGQLKVKDETWGFGANAGILVEPGEQSGQSGGRLRVSVGGEHAGDPGFRFPGPCFGQL